MLLSLGLCQGSLEAKRAGSVKDRDTSEYREDDQAGLNAIGATGTDIYPRRIVHEQGIDLDAKAGASWTSSPFDGARHLQR